MEPEVGEAKDGVADDSRNIRDERGNVVQGKCICTVAVRIWFFLQGYCGGNLKNPKVKYWHASCLSVIGILLTQAMRC
jgi:hypothetical protein